MSSSDPRDTEATIRRYWDCAGRRDWEGFGATLAPDVVYEVPQTRERVTGRAAYVRFNRDYPGDWQVEVRRVVAGAGEGVACTETTLDGEVLTGLHVFTMDAAGLVARVDDFWPEPYEPPADRAHLVERW